MSNFDISTPQLENIKRLIDACISLDMSNIEPLLSKKYQQQPFHEITDLPKGAN